MDRPKRTRPGYKVVSSSYVAVFIAGIWGYRRNWHDMMIHLLNAFENWPNDMASVGWHATKMWISNSILDRKIKDVSVHFSNDTLYRKPGERIKTIVHVHLTDFKNIKTNLIFEIKKKLEMKMLQTLAAETIANCVSKKEDIKYLVPKLLLEDLNKAHDDIWRMDEQLISISPVRWVRCSNCYEFYSFGYCLC